MYYRKYRPSRISELDNERIRETLGKSLLSNKFAHAYLLIGPRGSGKTSAARLIAKAVNCTSRKVGEEPCNKCALCTSISAGNCLDVIEIDAASNTGVDDIRSLREKVKLAPTEGEYKVYIIDEVHMLSTSAFNALLKTLEEPPEKIVFVLATTDPQKLPETIISRCLVYDFGRVTKSEIINSLRRVVAGEKLQISEEALARVADLANGSFRDGQKILQQLAMQSDNITLEHIDALIPKNLKRVVYKILAGVAASDSRLAIEEVEAFVAQEGKSRDLVNGLISYLRDILLLRNGFSVDVEDVKISDKAIEGFITGLIEGVALMRESPIAQLPLEMVIARMANQSDGGRDKGVSEEVEVIREDKARGAGEDDRKLEVEEKSIDGSAEGVIAKWPEVLSAAKPFNNSLVALLRACRPKEFSNGTLVVDVFYKFHKTKLAEPKNQATLEKVISGIIGEEVKVKFELSERKKE